MLEDFVTESVLEGDGRKGGKVTTTPSSGGSCADVQSSKWCNNLKTHCGCTCSADCNECTSGPPAPPASTAAPGNE